MSTTAESVAGVLGEVASAPSSRTIPTIVADAIVKTAAVISSTVSPGSTTGASPATSTTTTTTTTPSPSSSSVAISTPTPGQSFSPPGGNEDGKISVKDLSQALQHFGTVDYLVFVAMLAVCAVIGVYFGFIEKKQNKQKLAGKDGAGAAGIEERRGSEALDYLVGGRQMKVFPVALSLVAR